MNKVSATKLDILNYQSLQSGTKAQVKVGEFVFESNSVQHFSLEYELICLGEHHNQVSVFEVQVHTKCCSKSRISQRTGFRDVITFWPKKSKESYLPISISFWAPEE